MDVKPLEALRSFGKTKWRKGSSRDEVKRGMTLSL